MHNLTCGLCELVIRASDVFSGREPEWSRRTFNNSMSSNDLSQGSTTSNLSRDGWTTERKIIEPWSSVAERCVITLFVKHI